MINSKRVGRIVMLTPNKRTDAGAHDNAEDIDDIPLRIVAKQKKHGSCGQQRQQRRHEGHHQIIDARGNRYLYKSADNPALLLFYGQEKKSREGQDEKHIDNGIRGRCGILKDPVVAGRDGRGDGQSQKLNGYHEEQHDQNRNP